MLHQPQHTCSTTIMDKSWKISLSSVMDFTISVTCRSLSRATSRFSSCKWIWLVRPVVPWNFDKCGEVPIKDPTHKVPVEIQSHRLYRPVLLSQVSEQGKAINFWRNYFQNTVLLAAPSAVSLKPQHIPLNAGTDTSAYNLKCAEDS